MEERLGLEPRSIWKTLTESEIKAEYFKCETGENSIEEFEEVVCEFYKKKVNQSVKLSDT